MRRRLLPWAGRKSSALGLTTHQTKTVEPLSPAAVERFVTDGFVALERAFPTDVAVAAADALLALAGVSPTDSTWPGPVHRVDGSVHPAVVAAINTERLAGAIDQLVGPSMWEPRDTGYGSFPIRFPSEEDPGDAGWHIDGALGEAPDYLTNFVSQGRALLLLMLFTDVGPDDAPTRIRVGSHQPVARALAATDGAIVFSPERDCPEFVHLPIEHAVGDAGTVYLCHPFLIHAATWPHRGSGPRVLSQPCIHHPEGAGLGGFDYDLDPERPVKRAVRLALA